MGYTSLEKIALEARAEFENKTIDITLLETLFYKYIAFNDIHSFVEYSLSTFPRNNCSLATVYLQHKIPTGKIIPGWYNLDAHDFLMVEEVILDITADQFGGPKVYVGPLQNPWNF